MVALEYIRLLGYGFLGALTVQLLAFVVAIRFKRADVVDVAWGLSFLGVIASQLYASWPPSLITYLVDGLVGVWALRLSLHIAGRFRRSDVQDKRYTDIIARWPKRYRNMQLFFKIFVLQAGLASIVSLPIIIIHFYSPTIFNLLVFPWVCIGTIIWAVGFIWEWQADHELKQFLARSKRPALLTTGLWRLSRHPNYFGEITMWWGIGIISLGCGLFEWSFDGLSSLFALVGPLVITLLIRYVSGVPLAEKSLSQKDGWQQYKAKTPILVPRLFHR